jgi:hypothetical protein
MKRVDASVCTPNMAIRAIDETALLSARSVTMTNGSAAAIGQVLTEDFPRAHLVLAQGVHHLRRREALRFFCGRPQMAA